LLLDQEPPAALVDLALVELAGLGEEGQLVEVLPVDEAAEPVPRLLHEESRGVHAIVVAGVRLPHGRLVAELPADVEDELELPGQDVHAEEVRAAGDVEARGARRAEVPALPRVEAQGALGIEEGTEHRDHVRDLVVAEEGRTAAAARPVEAEEDEHAVAADVVVDVPPVRVADVADAVR